MINLETKTAYHVFDEFGMLCIPSDQSWESRSWWKKLWDKILKREWTPTWSNKSWRDSIGRTVLAWIAYGGPDSLAFPLEQCWIPSWRKKTGKLFRHFAHDERASRDHWSYFIIYRVLSDMDAPHLIKNFMDYIPRMRGLNSWMKALTGNKRAEWWYYTLAIPGAMLGNWWLRKCRKWGRISPELHHMDWMYNTYKNGKYIINNSTPWQKLWAWIIFTSMPAYALHNKAWQIYIMRKSPKRDTLRKILLKRVGKSNVMLRLLFCDTVTQEEVDNYPHMTGYRPGVYLDETCRRDIRELTDKEAEFNTYEWQLIKKLYNDGNKFRT